MSKHYHDDLAPHIREDLVRSASIPPSELLDRKVLRKIAKRPVLKPFLAGGIAVAGMGAMMIWISAMFAASGHATRPVVAGVTTSLIYLAICCVTALPLLARTAGPGLVLKPAKETP